MFADPMFLFLTADTLQQYANTKTLAVWRRVSFAKRGATLTKSLPLQKKTKNVNLPSIVLNTNKSNESVHFYHRGSKTGTGLSTWMKV